MNARAALTGIVAAGLLWPTYADTSLWLGLGIAMTTFVVMHGIRAAYEVPWLLGIIAFAACAQWLITPWIIYNVQGSYRVTPMAVEPAQYFLFAVPSTLAMVAGLYLPVWRMKQVAESALAARVASQDSRNFRITCDAMVFGGLAVRVFLVPFAPTSLKFALYLASLMSFVGAFALAIVGSRGWGWRVLLAVGIAAVHNASSLQFLELLLWCQCVAALVCYRYRPRVSTVIAALGPALIVFMAINAFKTLHRDDVRAMALDPGGRARVASATVFDIARDPATALGGANLVGTISRLNEGAITSRILSWVPAAEPYARGETIVTALRSALVPRILDPGKYVAGGAEIVPRFTGMELINNTSISITIPGEMYANFGLVGSWIGTFIFALFLGHLFAFFARRGQVSPVWWAWAPFVLFSALSAEQHVTEIVNGVTKSLIVMWVVTHVVPAWRAVPRRVRTRTRPRQSEWTPLAPTGDVREATS